MSMASSTASPTSSTKPLQSSVVFSPTTSKNSGSPTAVRHNSPTKSFPYWSIPVAGGGIILIFIVFFLVRKYKRQINYRRLVANLPHCPQDYTENSGEDEMPLMLDHLTDDEMLITA